MTSLTGRQRVLDLLQGKAIDRTPFMPITMMFAADRIGVKYKPYVTDYRVLVEAQIRVAEMFDIDHVSCISDPAREVADCGAVVQIWDDAPPTIDDNNPLLADKTTLARLRQPDPLGGGRMHDRVKAAALFKERVGGEKVIEGWIEGPCAEAVDMRGMGNLMMDFFDDPSFVRDLFEFVLEMELRFARAQIDAGIDIMGIGDAAASLVGPEIYGEFVWPYEKRMVEAVRKMGAAVRLHICGNTRAILEPMGRLGCEIVDLDYPAPIADARKAMGPDQILLGNLDPVSVVRNGTPATIATAMQRCHDDAGDRFIVGAGCEIPRDTPDANLKAMGDVARSRRRS